MFEDCAAQNQTGLLSCVELDSPVQYEVRARRCSDTGPGLGLTLWAKGVGSSLFLRFSCELSNIHIHSTRWASKDHEQ